MTDEQNALFAKARRALKTACVNLEEDDPEAASNRAYYAATAALLEMGETPRTHGGTHNRFYVHYVASERLPKLTGVVSSWIGLSKLANEQTTKPSAFSTGWPRLISQGRDEIRRCGRVVA